MLHSLYPGVECCCLAGLNNQQQLPVATLDVHLSNRISNILQVAAAAVAAAAGGAVRAAGGVSTG